MADGIRIRPQPARLRAEGVGSAAGRLFIVRDLSRPLEPGDRCVTCGVPHEAKTYHLRMDADGTTIVSTGVWERFLAMPDHGGFETVNVVADPPAQGLVVPPAVVAIRPAHP